MANSVSVSSAEYDGGLPCTCERFVIDHFKLRSNDNAVFYVTYPYSFLGSGYVPCSRFVDFYLFDQMVDQFKYLGTARTNANSIQEEVKSRLKSGNVCSHSVQNILSSRILSKNIKIKIYRTIILPVVWYGCVTWSLILRKERRLGVFENRVLRRIFGPKKDEVTGEGRKLHNEELNDLYSSTSIVWVSNRDEISGTCSTYGREEGFIQGFGGEP